MNALVNWLREEWRLMRLKNWATEYHVPASEIYPCTSADPRVQHTLKRLEQARQVMRRRRMRCLLTGKEYVGSSQTDLRLAFDKVRAVR